MTIIDEIGIVELINQKLGVDNREKIATGQVIKPTFRTSFCSTKRYMNYHYYFESTN